jgi:hypothetical protein
MPQECRVWAVGAKRVTTSAELMDMDEEVGEEKAADEDVAEEEETVTLGVSQYQAIQKELKHIRFELVDQQREAWEDKLLANEWFEAQQVLLRSILAQLPPTSWASYSAPQ